MALSNLEPLNNLACFLEAHNALLLKVDVKGDPDAPGVAIKITINTSIPAATDPQVYQAMTNAGFRTTDDPKLSFVCSGHVAQNVAPVFHGIEEGFDYRKCHAYNVLSDLSPATLRPTQANARAVVNHLQKLLRVERWLELSVLDQRRRLTLPWRLPSKYADITPLVERLLIEDSVSGMICFFYAYDYYVRGFAFSSVGNDVYCSVNREGYDAFYPAYNKLAARFREKIKDVCNAVQCKDSRPYGTR